MMSLKDIESLKNLAGILSIPFFAIACVADGFLIQMVTEFPLENKVIPLILRFTIAVIMVFLVQVLVTPYILMLGPKPGTIDLMPFPVAFAFICIAVGLYGFGSLIPDLKLPPSPLNVFWHLGILSYGLLILSIE